MGPFDELIKGLAAKERAAYLERVTDRDPWRGRDGRPEAARAGLLALIAGEEERLEVVLAGHLEREEAEAIAAEAFDGSDWGERLRRYEQSNDRLLLRLVQALRRRQEAAVPEDRRVFSEHREQAGVGAPAPCVEAVEGPPASCDAADAGAPVLAEHPTGILSELDALPLGLTASPPAAVAQDAASDPPPTIPDPPEPGLIEDVEPEGADPAPVATIGEEVPAAIDRGAPVPAGRLGRAAATVRRLAGSVLALFALASAAGLPAASARPAVEPTAASPARPSVGIPARGACRGPTSARWLCSSRPAKPTDITLLTVGGRAARGRWRPSVR